ncbi:uncharacterized protein LOC108601308 [Drosophila busckii]|uniref:uncharacterized protein LOC108601308 n=1 Tax=Drosophila busckii TaxID=30019 RepID=UPI00083E96C2|nr:uncharacterized protein LOC108601308 [Drosophila busckii]
MNTNEGIIQKDDTHGVGDSRIEKKPSACSLPDTLSHTSLCAPFTSCESFETICKAWHSRRQQVSTTTINTLEVDFDAKVIDLTTRLQEHDENEADVAKCLSLCVLLEGQHLLLTDSSEEDIPKYTKTRSTNQRFFEPDEIRDAFAAFKLFDCDGDNLLTLSQLKLALEKLAVPQTHLAAKQLMALIVGEQATSVTFCQFLLIYSAILRESDARAQQQLKSAEQQD